MVRAGGGQSPRGRRDPLGPRFTALWIASSASNLGDGVIAIALPLLVLVLEFSRQPSALATLTVITSVATLTLGIPVGAVLDRFDRLGFFRAANSVRIAAVAALALCALASAAPLLGAVYAIAFVVYAAGVGTDNAAPTLVPSTVAARDLPRANSRRYASEITANEFIGPPLGGLLFAVAAWLPFAVVLTALSAAAGALGWLRGHSRRQRPQPAPGPVDPGRVDGGPGRPVGVRATIADALAGLGSLWSNRRLSSVTASAALVNLAGSLTFPLLLLYATSRDGLDLSPVAFGAVLSMLGVGGLVGASIAPWLAHRLGEAGVLLAGTALMAADATALLATDRLPVVVAALVVSSLGAGAFSVVSVSAVQRATPGALMGRTIAGYRLAIQAMVPLGAVAAAALVGAFGFRATFAAAVAVYAIALLPVLRLRGPSSRPGG